MEKIRGQIFILGDHVDTDQILPGYAMAEPCRQLGRFAMAGVLGLDFAKRVKPGDIIVAGRNFGCGSSREQAPIALKMAGVGLIVAQSFARIFRRNAINIGLPVLVAGLPRENLQEGQVMEADLLEGKIVWEGGQILAEPLSGNTLKTLAYGGLIPRVRAELNIEKR